MADPQECFFLTVRIPFVEIDRDFLAGVSADFEAGKLNLPAMVKSDRTGTHTPPFAFHAVDSRVIAEKLLTLFTEEVTAVSNGFTKNPAMQELHEVVWSPIFAAVDAATLDFAERIAYRQEIEQLKRADAIDYDADIWGNSGLEFNERIRLLLSYLADARGWEPLIREELGLEESIEEVEAESKGQVATGMSWQKADARVQEYLTEHAKEHGIRLRPSDEEVDENLRKWAEHPVRIRELAKAIGCSVGLISKCPAWQSYQKTIRKARQPKAASLTDKTLNRRDTATEDPDQLERLSKEEQRERLIEESNKENRLDPSPLEKNVKPRKFTPRRKP